MKFKGFPILLLITIFSFGTSFSSNAASNLSTYKSINYEVKTQKSNWFSNVTQSVKRNFRTAQKYVSKTFKKVRKEQHDSNGIKKVGWGVLMIIAGALVTLGGILTFSGWGFVIGIGLVIWGALKIVVGILGTIFNTEA
jgi:Flp pilus assembly protein TadB